MRAIYQKMLSKRTNYWRSTFGMAGTWHISILYVVVGLHGETNTDIQRIAAFSANGKGGNPAGVVLLDTAVPDADMQKVAAEVGYSETAFAFPVEGSVRSWRVRYFSPESEVPFCGRATIALGVALGQRNGPGTYHLDLNHASITVDATMSAECRAATLASPPTRSRTIADQELHDAMALLGLTKEDLDPRLPPARIHGGADHLVFALRVRARLAAISYDLDKGREMMRRHKLVTIMLVHIEDDHAFSVRNAFASARRRPDHHAQGRRMVTRRESDRADDT